MPGPNPRNIKPKPDEYNKKGKVSLGKSKPPKELVPKPPPKKMKKGGRA